MFTNISFAARLAVAAVAVPAAGIAMLAAPAAAQASEEAPSAQAQAEAFVAAYNGNSGTRMRWGQQHFASGGHQSDQISQLNTLARRTGEITLTGVVTTEDSLILNVRSANREGSIRLLNDTRRPGKFLAFGAAGI